MIANRPAVRFLIFSLAPKGPSTHATRSRAGAAVGSLHPAGARTAASDPAAQAPVATTATAADRHSHRPPPTPVVQTFPTNPFIDNRRGIEKPAKPLRRVSTTASLIMPLRGLAHMPAAGTSRQCVGEGACETDAQRSDRVRHVTLRTQGQLLRVDHLRERQIAGRAGREQVLRGESLPSRRPGIRRQRCIDLRGGETPASRGLRNGRDQPPASSPDSRVRSDSAVS
jgi:hypothetical protein